MEQPFRLRVPGGDHVLSGHRLAGVNPGGVFIHGFRSHCDGQKSLAFSRHAKDRGRAWLRYDQRGCGKSTGDFAESTLSGAIDDSVLALDSIQQPAVLVGSSLGALIALHVARKRPRQLAGLLLIAPAVRFVERYLEALGAEALDTWREQGVFEFPDTYSQSTFKLRYDFYADAQQYSELGDLSFSCPIAIVHGARDELLPAGDALELAQKFRGGKVRTDIVPQGDHRLHAGIPLICRRLDQIWNEADI